MFPFEEFNKGKPRGTGGAALSLAATQIKNTMREFDTRSVEFNNFLVLVISAVRGFHQHRRALRRLRRLNRAPIHPGDAEHGVRSRWSLEYGHKGGRLIAWMQVDRLLPLARHLSECEYSKYRL